MKLKVLSVFPLPSKKPENDKKHVAIALQGTNDLNGNKYLLTKDGVRHEILGRGWICSRKAWDNKILSLEVEAPFDYDECELVP
ncbi:hypothetical protein FC52_GL000617 [Lactobacillus pasteurii DSM 23907 = CRBIP 24.76]|uniref:Lj928 prophage minor head protein n=1 Tax=Lactobacillus pasteurii DSM 23907 = CRBIP 24.76 TaxID=1423790 RepID=I7LAX9_9LACO|nr:hypothetical protein [Lactobacillus pasteurii]KRK07446.1 hypothetical protein FC52_GL000617 [Lactobacillus pasteurii DSM 23907 = CRBIP 24.76]TDG76693.1 hypothetical protein C5L33_000254 [Lactobacillus pasteurii]CCI85071.1 Lj928 prophage minor head protein [Lactobacillus pasteurii DSM 23907 = CRBIP 24.76]